MRFGLVGTGPWAELAHAPGLAAADGVELVGIWGRSLDRAQPLADSYGVAAYDDYAALLADVEAVAFAVPPAVQGRDGPRGGGGRPSPPPRQAGGGRSRRGPGAARGRHGGRRGVGGLLHRPVRRRDPGLDRRRPRAPRAGTAGGCAGSAPCRSPTTRSAPHRGGTRPVRSGTPGRTRCPRSSPRSGPICVAHGGRRPGRRGLPRRTPRVRADQHHRADPVRAARRQPVTRPPCGARPGSPPCRPARRARSGPCWPGPPRSWWRAPSSGQPHELDLRFGVQVVELLAQAQEQLDDTGRRSGRPDDGAARPVHRRHRHHQLRLLPARGRAGPRPDRAQPGADLDRGRCPAEVRMLTGDVRDPRRSATRSATATSTPSSTGSPSPPSTCGPTSTCSAGASGQYVFISSASAYQKPPARLPITESTPLRNPFWQYSRDKIACEDLLVGAYREDGFPVTIVRPSHTYDRDPRPVRRRVDGARPDAPRASRSSSTATARRCGR